MIDSPYQPPRETADLRLPIERQPEQRLSIRFDTLQIVCYGWLLILFLVWQQDGLNFLIQKDIGRLISIVTSCFTLAFTTIYIRQNRSSKRRCVAFFTAAGLFQFGVVNTIANHSVDRFPM